MKIQVMSDIHVEFHADNGDSFFASCDPSNVDALVIAGDIATYSLLRPTLEKVCDRYKDQKVIFVPGNHEFYGSCFEETLQTLREVEENRDNLFVLYNDSVTIDRVEFVGTTLWFPPALGTTRLARQYNDFFSIEDFRTQVLDENKKAIEFLNRSVTDKSFVISHFLPSESCINAKYKGSEINCFFFCPMDKLIFQKKPKYWIHGHTHLSGSRSIYTTKTICNPLGYIKRDLNEQFDPKLIIDTERVQNATPVEELPERTSGCVDSAVGSG